MAVASNNDLIVVDQATGRVFALWDANGDGSSGAGESAVLVSKSGLNHGVVIDESQGYLYASTSTDVYRWRYTAGERSTLSGEQHVVSNIPCCHHVTRTLQISPDNALLYVQTGSASNLDPDPTHAEIRRFKIASLGSTPFDWNNAELFASGLRNEVGFRFDEAGNLWGVENGVDNLYRADLGGDIHNTNPCEELNFFPTASGQTGRFYGYPYCWSEGILPTPPGEGEGSQWLQSDFEGKGVWTDAWCKDPANVVPPSLCLPAHTAPLDIIFGNLTGVGADLARSGFISLHGSWNRQPAAGYKVLSVSWFKNGTIATDDLLRYDSSSATGPGWIRPVGLGFVETVFGTSLMVSSDASGQIVGIAYNGKQ